MQREILFRCWDVQEKKMFIPKNISNGLICSIPEDDDEQFFVHMQYTGIRANGIRIFEGDIVATPKGTCVVTFESGCFYAKVSAGIYRLGGWISGIEVIGNIYEHPELLMQNNIDNG